MGKAKEKVDQQPQVQADAPIGPDLDGALAALQQVLAGGRIDAALLKRRAELQAEEAQLNEAIRAVRTELAAVNAEIARQEKAAAAARTALAVALAKAGIDPGTFGLSTVAAASKQRQSGNGYSRSDVRILVNGQDTGYNTPSRTLWYSTRGCGGTAADGRLTMGDLYKLLGGGDEQAGLQVYAAGGWRVELHRRDGETITLEGVKD